MTINIFQVGDSVKIVYSDGGYNKISIGKLLAYDDTMYYIQDIKVGKKGIRRADVVSIDQYDGGSNNGQQISK